MTENQIGLYICETKTDLQRAHYFVDTVLPVNESCPATCIVRSISTYWLVINDYTYVACLTVLTSQKIFHHRPMPDTAVR